MNDLNVVCVGGGTGMSTMLRGLKKHTDNLTAVVTVADNGGSSGDLRKDLHILPPGDIRNCLIALAETEPLLEELMQHRFSDGSLKGHSLGNLLIAGLADMTGNFALAVEKAHDILRVRGKVFPVTLEDVQLMAEYDDGSQVIGESEITSTNKGHKKRIRKMSLIPEGSMVYSQVLKQFEEAEVIVLGPGSLFTSIVPNLLVNGVCDAIRKSPAKVVYVSNIMTQPGETDRFTLMEHVRVIEGYLGEGVIDHIVANDSWPDTMVIDHYNDDGAELVLPLDEDDRITSVPMVTLDDRHGYVRHKTDILASTIMSLG